MIFEALYDAAKRGELLCIEGGVCRWHLRRDAVLIIHEIIATKHGAGSAMLSYLAALGREKGAASILAKCPVDLPSNEFYRRRGFQLEKEEQTKSGRKVNVWRLLLSSAATAAIPLSVASPANRVG